MHQALTVPVLLLDIQLRNQRRHYLMPFVIQCGVNNISVCVNYFRKYTLQDYLTLIPACRFRSISLSFSFSDNSARSVQFRSETASNR